MAVNLAASHAFFQSFSSPRQIQQIPSCNLGNLLRFPPSRRIPISSVARASAAEAEAAVTAGKEESLAALEVSEIDGKCKKWAWRGYAINYFVIGFKFPIESFVEHAKIERSE